MTHVLFGGKVVRSFTFTVFPEALPFSWVFSSSTTVWFFDAVEEPLAEDERYEPMLGTHGASARSPPTTAKIVMNFRLEGLEGAAAGRGGEAGAGGALLLVNFSDI